MNIFHNQNLTAMYGTETFVATAAPHAMTVTRGDGFFAITLYHYTPGQEPRKVDWAQCQTPSPSRVERHRQAQAAIHEMMARHSVRFSCEAPEVVFRDDNDGVEFMGHRMTIQRSSKTDVTVPWCDAPLPTAAVWRVHTPVGADITVAVPAGRTAANIALAREQVSLGLRAWACTNYETHGKLLPKPFPACDSLNPEVAEEIKASAAVAADRDKAAVRAAAKAAANVGLTPQSIKAALDATVHGQNEAKDILSLAAYQHTRRTKMKNPAFRKSNVLLMGPTGSGKTYLAENLAKALNVPFVIFDVSRLTAAGYHGDDVEDIAKAVMAAADGDKEKAQRAIVVLDEIDKLCAASAEAFKARDISGFGRAAQQQILKFIEGDSYKNSGTGLQRGVELNTHNILFICCGAFAHVKDQATDAESLIKAGLIPELVGRLPVRAVLQDLTAGDLVHAARLPGGAVEEYTAMLAMDEITLEVQQDALDMIAHAAKSRGTGVRGLREIFETVLRPTLFTAPDNVGTTVNLTAEMVMMRLAAPTSVRA